MIDRFSAYLLIRRFLKRPDSRNQALAVEAIMEENGLESTNLTIGESLIIPPPTTAPPTTAAQ